ncbi:hypothetical protein ISS40_11330 [Candidatus Bathyarchaeota archaeon]|nr:hypothetical protein [Candidatus Bathyarchaeota archaeon]
MCQLGAYLGDRPVIETLLDSIRAQEGYIGGHSTGVATLHEGGFDLYKDLGPLNGVAEEAGFSELTGNAGIAHSRYLTEPTNNGRYNFLGASHPWIDDTGKLVLMHNGVITNYRMHFDSLRERHVFQSYIEEFDDICDSEVALHLLSEEVSKGAGMPDALRRVAQELTGLFLLCAMHVDHPETIWIANWLMPCYVALGEGEAMFSSVRAGLRHVKGEMSHVFQPPKNSIIEMTRGGVSITPMDPMRKTPVLKPNVFELSRRIIETLKDVGEAPLLPLSLAMSQRGRGEVFGLTEKEWEDLQDAGFGDTNINLEVLNMLASEGRVNVRTVTRREYGVMVPRIMFSVS